MARMLVIIALVAVLLQLTSAQLKWPNAYQVSGNIYLPYGDIAEPYTAYVNMGTGQSRLDTYGGKTCASKLGNEAYVCYVRAANVTTWILSFSPLPNGPDAAYLHLYGCIFVLSCSFFL